MPKLEGVPRPHRNTNPHQEPVAHSVKVSRQFTPKSTHLSPSDNRSSGRRASSAIMPLLGYGGSSRNGAVTQSA